MRVVTLTDPGTVADEVAERFFDVVEEAQGRGETPHIALSGGSTARLIHRAIATAASHRTIAWDRVVFWFGDERFVVRASTERNAGQARADFLDAVGATRVHEIAAVEDADGVADAARRYSDLLAAEAPDGFDLVLLGMGPDGHVASLFPGYPQLEDTSASVLPVTDSPKPPLLRVTLTLPALNRSRAVWFAVTGAEKSAARARAWAPTGSVARTPARGISGPSVTWFVDQAAAGS